MSKRPPDGSNPWGGARVFPQPLDIHPARCRRPAVYCGHVTRENGASVTADADLPSDIWSVFFATMTRALVSAALLLCATVALAQTLTVLQGSNAYTALFRQSLNPLMKQNYENYCPYCDSSVYGYCSDKLLHDACCCIGGHRFGRQHHLPTECRYADCSFLHANTCQEHSLITRCCCSNNFFRINTK
ncbi:Hypothetical predicted protein [Cloeon dipterum]|uniref:CCC domain-containing protein n=1 Tax=Cloeon dipterum TaxID=197152 RepID=A0A8S1C1K1_9INSE|nr:Hypothetical predicted protein [Cloeon dipterum]